MKRLSVAFALLAALTLALGTVLAQDQDDEAAAEEVNQQWQERFNAGDAEGVAELYTEDAVFYDSDGSVYEGRDAIQEAIQEFIDAGFRDASLEPIEVEVLNDTAYQILRYSVQDDEGETVEGYNLSILKHENGEWLIHRDFANFVMPEELLGALVGEAPTAEMEEEPEEEPAEEMEDEPEEEVDEDVETEVQQAVVEVSEHDTYGEYLVDGEGRSLYLFVNDDQGESVCYDQCAVNWPPLLTTEDAEAGEGVDSDLLGTTERQDGSLQVTYNDWPLYYFVNDAEPGDTNGQGVGEVWYLVSPDGEAIEEEEDE
jgi:uncharacterized protein (TIGR02246 family)